MWFKILNKCGKSMCILMASHHVQLVETNKHYDKRLSIFVRTINRYLVKYSFKITTALAFGVAFSDRSPTRNRNKKEANTIKNNLSVLIISVKPAFQAIQVFCEESHNSFDSIYIHTFQCSVDYKARTVTFEHSLILRIEYSIG